MKKEKVAVVKIDPILLEEVEKIIKKGENRIRFANKKQFVDIAVHELLCRLKREKEGDGDKKR